VIYYGCDTHITERLFIKYCKNGADYLTPNLLFWVEVGCLGAALLTMAFFAADFLTAIFLLILASAAELGAAIDNAKPMTKIQCFIVCSFNLFIWVEILGTLIA